MTDFNNTELKIKDKVVFVLNNELLNGTVIGFTAQKVKIDTKSTYDEYNNIFPDRVIKVDKDEV